MRVRDLLLGVTIVLVSQPVTGQATPGGGDPITPGTHVPADGTMPNYFSGTNCRASASFAVESPPPGYADPAYVYFMTLEIEGTVVDSYTYTPFQPQMFDHALGVVFDSTHFANGTHVIVRLYAVDSYGRTYEQTDSAPIQNIIMEFESADPLLTPDPSQAVHGLMSGQNFDQILVNGGSWSKYQYFADMQGATVVFCATHGAPELHEMSDYTENAFPPDYLIHRQVQIGSGIPPDNTGHPPVFFMHLLACNTGIGPDYFDEVNYPYYMNWGGPWMENQGHMTYKCYVYLKDYKWHADQIWSKLVTGTTGWRTQFEFNDFITSNPGVVYVKDYYTDQHQPMQVGDLAFFYDPMEGGCLRIKTVYTGNNTAPVGWYR